MKVIFRSAMLLALLLAASCAKEKVEAIVEQTDEQTEQLEKTKLEANTVSDNLEIQGATKKDGEPPAPNGTLMFDITGTSKIALLDEGFDVLISSEAQIVGAYLKIKAEDGTAAETYHDVNIDANTSDDKKVKRKKRKGMSSFVDNQEDGVLLDVDFTAEIKAGKFCYEICVYDANGNISEPEEVCVKVESWGGKAEANGKWILDKWFYDHDEERIYLSGEENCIVNTRTMNCEGVPFEDVESTDCLLTEYWTLELSEDGSYTEKEKIIWTDTYTDISQNPCLDEAVSEDVYTFESTGKWAYVDEEDKFVFVTYHDKEVYNDEVDEYSAEPGDDSVYYGFGNYDGEVRLAGDNLVIESFEETTIYFKK